MNLIVKALDKINNSSRNTQMNSRESSIDGIELNSKK